MDYRQTTHITLGEKTIITDPCHNPNSPNASIADTRPGEWTCNCIYDKNQNVITGLVINHNDYQDTILYTEDLTRAPLNINVDSGMAGFFDLDYFSSVKSSEKQEEWYETVRKETYKTVPNEPIKLTDNPEIKETLDKLKTLFPDNRMSIKTYSDIECTVIENMPMSGTYVSKQIIDFLDCDIVKTNSVSDKTSKKNNTSEIEQHVKDICDKCTDIICRNDRSAFEKTRRVVDAVGIDGKGYVSTTAYGDGSYNCYTKCDKNGKIVCMILNFDNHEIVRMRSPYELIKEHRFDYDGINPVKEKSDDFIL
ncbi:DUF4241 domain-containing protein [bacterium]|nr:DUF4241 domain-containing protein [bacterium]